MTENNREFNADGEPEEPPSRLARFCSFLYNKEAKQFIGRTGCSWLKIIAFYVVYYSCLAGFFLGMLSVFMYGIITQEMPYRTGLNSLLNMNPGLGFRPHADVSDTLIEFTAGKQESYVQHVANLQELYDLYELINKKPEGVNVRTQCGKDAKPDNEPEKICKFDWTKELPGCLPGNDFGYAEGKPCVIVKLNRIFGWLPDPETEVPHPLLDCYGENPADTENIGEVAYFPSMSLNLTGVVSNYGYFNQAFFPYLKQAGYRSPLVAVKFENLRVNNLVMIECRLRNMKNSQYGKVDRNGMVRFEMLLKK